MTTDPSESINASNVASNQNRTDPIDSKSGGKVESKQGKQTPNESKQKARLPNLSFFPEYPANWNGPDHLVTPMHGIEKQAVDRIYKKLGTLVHMETDSQNSRRPDCATGLEVAKGLIRRLLKSQIYFIGTEKERDQYGYVMGSEILERDDFFASLFKGIMSETRMQVPHYVYTINFCDELMTQVSQFRIPDPAFTVSLFSLMDVMKNIHEQTTRQSDLASGTAYGWLNIWLLGVQKILVCNKIASSQHLHMFRNAIAHHQFSLDHNYVQLFNKTENGKGVIDWMVRITLGDLAGVNMVLKMLHNSGYILNSSQDDQNMNRRKKRSTLFDGPSGSTADGLRAVATELGLDPSFIEDVLMQCNGDKDAAIQQLLEMNANQPNTLE